jgi:ribonuclease G
MEAAEEIARQLRLRDIGGIIVVDFIDMKLPDNKKKLQDAMDCFMRPDRAKHAVLPISKFGLMQITRQRMKQEMNIITAELCPTCNGTGKITATLLLEDEIEKKLLYLVTHQHKDLTLSVHPILYSHLTKGFLFNSIRHKWNRKFKTKIKVTANTNYHLTEFHFFDKDEEQIKF